MEREEQSRLTGKMEMEAKEAGNKAEEMDGEKRGEEMGGGGGCRRRWFILFAVSIANFANNMTWITFVPVSSFAIQFFDNAFAPTLFNVAYMLCSPMAFVAMFAVSRRDGLRRGCLIGAWVNLTGNLIRLGAIALKAFSSEESPTGLGDSSSQNQWLFSAVFAGQILGACAQPFAQFLPTKLAAVWFPHSQRLLANSIGSLASPFGTAATYLLAPHIVRGNHPGQFFTLAAIVAGLSLVAALASLGVTSSPTEGSSSSAQRLHQQRQLSADSTKPLIRRNSTKKNKNAEAKIEKENPVFEDESEVENGLKKRKINRKNSFIASIGDCFRHPPFLVLALCLGSLFGAYTGLYTLLQPALCSHGYPNTFSGFIGTLMILSGVGFSLCVGAFVDRTKWFEETAKCLMAAAALFSLAFLGLLELFPDSGQPIGGDSGQLVGGGSESLVFFLSRKTLIAVTVVGFGACGIALYPLGMELGVETTFPVHEGISTGLLLFIGQMFGIVYVAVVTALRRAPDRAMLAVQTCTGPDEDEFGTYDMKYSILAWASLLSATAVFFTAAFWPRYRRWTHEKCRLQMLAEGRNEQQMTTEKNGKNDDENFC